ncbi:MAG: HD-GYP domain-containing protein [bacterium]
MTAEIRFALNSLHDKDTYTYWHSIRVQRYSLMIGNKLKLNEDQMQKLEVASLLHDIGKIHVPDEILKKSGRLTKQEFETIKEHPTNSGKVFENLTDLEQYEKYISSHHERYDGQGYPNGLKGEEIPLLSRIIFVADSFDAMTSDRPYRKGMPLDVAVSELIKNRDTQFDPRVVDTFIDLVRLESEEVYEVLKISGD